MPSTAWVRVLPAEPSSLAMPKSSTLTSPPEITMFAGLMSRCTSPAAWAASRPSHTAAAMATASSGGSTPASSRIRRSVRPATNSITMNGVVPSTPQSKTVTRRGWLRAATWRASRSNLARKAGSAANCGLRTLTATSRPSTSSLARHTVAMPPVPSTSKSAYRPPSRRAPFIAMVRSREIANHCCAGVSTRKSCQARTPASARGRRAVGPLRRWDPRSARCARDRAARRYCAGPSAT